MPADATFEHVGLCAPAEVFEKTVSFYETVFGWRRFERNIGPSGGGAFLTDGAGASIELYQRAAPPIGGANHLALSVESDRFDEVLGRARAFGVAVADPISPEPGSMTTFLTDPAGNRIQLSARPAPFAPRH